MDFDVAVAKFTEVLNGFPQYSGAAESDRDVYNTMLGITDVVAGLDVEEETRSPSAMARLTLGDIKAALQSLMETGSYAARATPEYRGLVTTLFNGVEVLYGQLYAQNEARHATEIAELSAAQGDGVFNPAGVPELADRYFATVDQFAGMVGAESVPGPPQDREFDALALAEVQRTYTDIVDDIRFIRDDLAAQNSPNGIMIGASLSNMREGLDAMRQAPAYINDETGFRQQVDQLRSEVVSMQETRTAAPRWEPDVDPDGADRQTIADDVSLRPPDITPPV